ncbi:hypothetical protein KIN20_007663 [Parelaphostrongylus tenuis]|uniref:Uncharacterized protein n=1 Tax=Parelaphostrongylus tenuis TaxID=148309 RepID=A0AAD5MVR9_PARTN|nr:hypothetical protein KIN20_007663 [Parelaphostrongylus tenuis]
MKPCVVLKIDEIATVTGPRPVVAVEMLKVASGVNRLIPLKASPTVSERCGLKRCWVHFIITCRPTSVDERRRLSDHPTAEDGRILASKKGSTCPSVKLRASHSRDELPPVKVAPERDICLLSNQLVVIGQAQFLKVGQLLACKH